jgi:hypothetical protein
MNITSSTDEHRKEDTMNTDLKKWNPFKFLRKTGDRSATDEAANPRAPGHWPRNGRKYPGSSQATHGARWANSSTIRSRV